MVEAYLYVNIKNSCIDECFGGILTSHSQGWYGESTVHIAIQNSYIANNSENGVNLLQPTTFNISYCEIRNNTCGINISGTNSDSNIIWRCNIKNNLYGIYLNSSYSGVFYHNNLVNNVFSSYDNGNNTWDNGYPSGGNYWSDFDEPSEGAYDNNMGANQNIPGSDGIVDSPYNISGGNNIDRYPLIKPFNPSNDTIPPTTTIIVGEPHTGDYITSNTSINLIAVDNPGGSGVNYTEYQIWYMGSWGSWQIYNGSFNLTGECIHYVRFHSVDNAGNVENYTVHTFYVDNTAPVSWMEIGEPRWGNYITNETQITLYAEDPGTCSVSNHTPPTFNYSFDGVTWFTYVGWNLTLNITFNCTFQWYCVDSLGNGVGSGGVSPNQYDFVVVDEVNEFNQNSGNSYEDENGELHVTNNSEFEIGEDWDPFIGFNGYRIIYRIWWNGTKTWTPWIYGPWNSSVKFTLNEECKHFVEWYVIDTAGNNESEPNWQNLHNQTLYVDDSPPITIDEVGNLISYDAVENVYWVTFPTVVWLNATDKPAGECAVGCYYTWYEIWYDSNGDDIVDTFLINGTVGSSFSNSSRPKVFVTINLTNQYRYRIQWYAVDFLGHIENLNERYYDSEEKQPDSWLNITHDPDGYVTPYSTFTIHAIDDSGKWRVYCRIDKKPLIIGGWNEEIRFQLNENYGHTSGKHHIEYWAIDAAGNEETPHHKETYIVDADGPNTYILFNGIHEVTKSAQCQIPTETRFVLKAEDEGCGVKNIFYRVDDGEWQEYTEPFTIVEKGLHTIYCYAVDRLGNIGLVQHKILKVGDVEPITKCFIIPEKPTGSNDWYKDPVIITLAATDEGSGIDYTMYRIDGGYWERYRKPFIIDKDGVHIIQYYSVDRVGNKEEIKEKQIKIDFYGPQIIIKEPLSYLYIFNKAIVPLPGGKPLVIGKITIKASIIDAVTSGVESAEIYIDGKIKSTFVDEIDYTLDEMLFGTHTIKIIACDRAGNKEVKEFKVAIYNIKWRIR